MTIVVADTITKLLKMFGLLQYVGTYFSCPTYKFQWILKAQINTEIKINHPKTFQNNNTS